MTPEITNVINFDFLSNFFGSIGPFVLYVWDKRYFWMPFIFVKVFVDLWVYYLKFKTISKIEWINLEVKFPRDIRRTPQAMEVVLSAFHDTKTANNPVKIYWEGVVRPWMSLEIFGSGGDIHFVFHIPKDKRNLVESQIYSQYPDCEIKEIDDYTDFVLTDEFRKDWQSWGGEFTLTDADPYPIKTYVNYGLDKQGTKEEEKVDPMTPFLEFLGSLREGHQVWLQIMILAADKNDGYPDLKKIAEGEIAKMVKEVKKMQGLDDTKSAMLLLTPGQRKAVEAMEQNMNKLGFRIGMRVLYLAKEKLDKSNIGAITSTIKQYSAPGLNGLKPTNTTSVDYPIFEDYRVGKMKSGLINDYRNRSFFYKHIIEPLNFTKKTPFMFSIEELATIYHFPGRVSETPTFARVESKKGEAPVNLPI